MCTDCLLIGYPIAKSLLCVAKIANSAARPEFVGRVTIRDTPSTTKNTHALARKTANKNFQLTNEKSSFARDKNINDGRANVPTNVFRPLASGFDIISSLPAIYLQQ